MRRREFEVHYLPVVDLETNSCVGAEALLRWRHPQEGMVNPDLFVLLAEETGLIVPITEWLMDRVARDIGPALLSDRSLHIAINLSPIHFQSRRILDAADQFFGEGGVPADQIIYEITERGLISQTDTGARDVMASLRSRKSAVALDDFGAGHSNLSYIGSFPLDYLKIDSQFVSAIGTGSIASQLVDSIIDIGKRLDLQLIAEGVETTEQAEYLLAHGVQHAQGYLFSRPLPIDKFLRFICFERS